MLASTDDKSIFKPKLCLTWLHAANLAVFLRGRGCESSTLTGSVVLLWCKKGLCLAEGEAIMALLWIMRPSMNLISRWTSVAALVAVHHYSVPYYIRGDGPDSPSLQTISVLTSHFIWRRFKHIFPLKIDFKKEEWKLKLGFGGGRCLTRIIGFINWHVCRDSNRCMYDL